MYLYIKVLFPIDDQKKPFTYFPGLLWELNKLFKIPHIVTGSERCSEKLIHFFSLASMVLSTMVNSQSSSYLTHQQHLTHSIDHFLLFEFPWLPGCPSLLFLFCSSASLFTSQLPLLVFSLVPQLLNVGVSQGLLSPLYLYFLHWWSHPVHL